MATYPDDNRPASDNQPAAGPGDGELFWLAFCYVTGELSPEQTLEFETRLESDQEARESVAQAVELAAAGQLASAQVAAAPVVSAPCAELSVAPRWTGGWALALAASLALVIAGYSLLAKNAAENASSEPSQPNQRLVDVWAAATWLDEADAEIGGESNRLENLEVAALDLDEGDLDENELQVSEWLLEAVSAAQGVQAVESSHREG